MRCVTHQFSSIETLDRVRRWLVEAGIPTERMVIRHHGVPMIAVAVENGEADAVEMIVRAAAREDPDGLPGFWDLARLRPVAPGGMAESVDPPPPPAKPAGFVLSWQPAGRRVDSEPVLPDVSLQIAYRELRA